MAGYKSIIRSSGRQCYYRFTSPASKDHPVMIELFSRKPMEIELASGQNIVPVRTDDNISSLSAILMDDAYYSIIMESRSEVNGLPVITPGGLLDLKNKELVERKYSVTKIYDGFRYQVYAQYFALQEMGDDVKSIKIYSKK